MKILMVDDERDCLDSLEIALDPLHYQIVKETDPAIAFETYKKNNFDLIISDVRMNGMSGIDLMKKIKDININQRIIIISAFEDIDTVRECIDNQVFAFLSKPINAEKFIDKVQKIDNDLKSNDNITLNKLTEDYDNLKRSYIKLLDYLFKQKSL